MVLSSFARRTFIRRPAHARRGRCLFVVLLWTALAVGALPPAQAQEAREVLEQTVAAYRDLQQYYLEGTVSVVMQAAGGRQAMDLDVLMAERKPVHLRAEIDSPSMQMTVVSDGDTTWMYLPSFNQYLKRAGAFTPGLAGSPMPDLLGEYQELADDVEQAAILREEGFDVGGEVRPSYVLDVTYTPRGASADAEADSSRKTLWIDKERFVVLKDKTRARMANSPFGGPMVIEETTTFSAVRLDQALPDSLFAFSPPPGATEMDPSALLGEGEGSVGSPAKGFTLPSLAGEDVSLESLRGKVVLVNFWATWCGPCRVEMPALDQLYREFAGEGLVVLAVDLAEPEEEVRAYVEQRDFTFPVLLDAEAHVAELYGATAAIPSTFIIDREGVISHHFIGARPEAEFRAALKELGFE